MFITVKITLVQVDTAMHSGTAPPPLVQPDTAADPQPGAGATQLARTNSDADAAMQALLQVIRGFVSVSLNPGLNSGLMQFSAVISADPQPCPQSPAAATVCGAAPPTPPCSRCWRVGVEIF